MCNEPKVLNIHVLSKEEFSSVTPWCNVYVYCTALLNKARTQLYSVINVTDLVEVTRPGSVWEKF